MQSTRFDVHQCVRQKNPCRMYVNFDDKLSASLFVCLYSESAQPMRSDMHAISNVLALFPIFLHCCCIQLSLQVVVQITQKWSNQIAKRAKGPYSDLLSSFSAIIMIFVQTLRCNDTNASISHHIQVTTIQPFQLDLVFVNKSNAIQHFMAKESSR